MRGLHRTRLAVLGAICLLAPPLALAAPADPAAARPPGGWLPLSCATGAITDVGARRDQEGRTFLGLSGWIQPCVPSEPSNGFAVIVYRAMGAAVGGPFTPYGSPPGPTEFALQVELFGSGDTAGNELRAACLAHAPHGRLACVSVDEGSPGELPVVAPLPADDPRVRDAIVDVGGPVRQDPVCGTCL